MLIGKNYWLLCVLISQTRNRATNGLFFLLILFKFLTGVDSGFLRYSYFKAVVYLIIISESLILTQYYYKEDARRAAYLDHLWKNGTKITQFVDARKIVLVDITDYWCVMCKYNKIMELYGIRMTEPLQRKTLFQLEVTLLTNIMKHINYWHIII